MKKGETAELEMVVDKEVVEPRDIVRSCNELSLDLVKHEREFFKKYDQHGIEGLMRFFFISLTSLLYPMATVVRLVQLLLNSILLVFLFLVIRYGFKVTRGSGGKLHIHGLFAYEILWNYKNKVFFSIL